MKLRETADVEMCPICGRTGEYKDRRGRLVEKVHDPLGLEAADMR